MTVIKVKDYARQIEEFDDTIHVKCFTDELNDDVIDKNKKESETDKILSSFIRCNGSCSVL